MELIKSHNFLFGIQTRPDIWTEFEIDELLHSGCFYVELGTESLTVEGIQALSKFRDAARVLELTDYFRLRVPHVGVNIVDVGNPDLSLLPSPLAVLETDNEGDAPPAFVPYPGTPWGNRALAAVGATRSWDHVAALHGVYALMARSGFLASILQRSSLARRTASFALRILTSAPRSGYLIRTRFERRMFSSQSSEIPLGKKPQGFISLGANSSEKGDV